MFARKDSRDRSEASFSIIGPDMQVVGDLVTEGSVRIEGRVHGSVRAGQRVVLGPTGVVEGDVWAQEAVLGGRVRGSVTAEQRLEVQKTASLEGEVRTRAQRLLIEEGARVVGQIAMIDAPEVEEPRALPRGAGATVAE